MSTNFPGGTFAYQKVTPSEDAAVRRATLGDGILQGCRFSYSGGTLTMGAGLLFICGRVVRHPQVQHWSVTNAASGFARLGLTVDLSRTATADAFDQVVDTIEYADSLDGFTPLVQEDINAGGIRYQVAACVFLVSASNIVGVADVLDVLDGKPKVLEITALEQLDSLLETGNHRLNIQAGNATVGGVVFSRATVAVEGYDASNARQTLSMIGSPTRAIRSCEGGTWKPWCIDNPPMTPGVEYRTTELWEGQPVFIKRFAIDPTTFKGEDTDIPHGIANMGICIYTHAIWNRTDMKPLGWRSIPAADNGDHTLNAQIRDVNETNIHFELGWNIWDALKRSTDLVYATIKYTKV